VLEVLVPVQNVGERERTRSDRQHEMKRLCLTTRDITDAV